MNRLWLTDSNALPQRVRIINKVPGYKTGGMVNITRIFENVDSLDKFNGLRHLKNALLLPWLVA